MSSGIAVYGFIFLNCASCQISHSRVGFFCLFVCFLHVAPLYATRRCSQTYLSEDQVIYSTCCYRYILVSRVRQNFSTAELSTVQERRVGSAILLSRMRRTQR